MAVELWYPLILLAVFGATSCCIYAAAHWVARYEPEVDARLAALYEPPGGLTEARRRGGRLAVAAGRGSQRWHEFFLPTKEGEKQQIQHRLQQAGYESRPSLTIYYLSKLAFLIVPPATSVVVAELSPAIDFRSVLHWGCIVGGVGFLLPGIWLDRQIAARHRIIRRSLPDFLDLLLICLRGGLSVQGALIRVTDELQLAHPLLAAEAARMVRDVELGATIDAAFLRFGERCGEEGVRTLGSFIRESQRFGVELIDALRNHAEMMRVDRELEAEAAAQKAAVKILIPTLLLIFPAVFVVLAGPAAIKIQEAFAK